MRTAILAALAAAAAVLTGAGPAAAGSFVPPCGYGSASCAGNGGSIDDYQMDYTVAGREQWNFWLDTSDPAATVYLQSPNEVYRLLYYSDDPTMPAFDGNVPYTWYEVQRPKWAAIQVDAPISWYDCGPGVTGLCGQDFAVWGNGTYLQVSSASPYVLHWSITAFIPEPATWATMLLGFAGLGAALRYRRTALFTAR